MSDTNDGYQIHSKEYLQKQKDILTEYSGRILDFLYDRQEDLAASTARNYARELRYLVAYGYENDLLSNDSGASLFYSIRSSRDEGQRLSFHAI